MRIIVLIAAAAFGLFLSAVGVIFSMAVEGARGIPTFTYVLLTLLAVAHVIGITLSIYYVKRDRLGRAATMLISPLFWVMLAVFGWVIVSIPFRI